MSYSRMCVSICSLCICVCIHTSCVYMHVRVWICMQATGALAMCLRMTQACMHHPCMHSGLLHLSFLHIDILHLFDSHSLLLLCTNTNQFIKEHAGNHSRDSSSHIFDHHLQRRIVDLKETRIRHDLLSSNVNQYLISNTRPTTHGGHYVIKSIT